MTLAAPRRLRPPHLGDRAPHRCLRGPDARAARGRRRPARTARSSPRSATSSARDGWYLSFFRTEPASTEFDEDGDGIASAEMRAAIATNGADLARRSSPARSRCRRRRRRARRGLGLPRAGRRCGSPRSSTTAPIIGARSAPRSRTSVSSRRRSMCGTGARRRAAHAVSNCDDPGLLRPLAAVQRPPGRGHRALTAEQLAMRASPEHWPVWAIVGPYRGGTRVYWLCHVAGRARGRTRTPWPDRRGRGLGGRPDASADRRRARGRAARRRTRSSTASWIPGRPTPSALTFERTYRDVHQVHSRTSILQRLLTHEAYHDGEIAVALGSHDLEPPYIWRAYDQLRS